MKCRWCGVDFEKHPGIRKRLWDDEWECKSQIACNRRRKAK